MNSQIRRRQILLPALLMVVSMTLTHAQTGATKTGYAPVNGINLYYETHGTGDPLVILHGGLGSTESIADLISQFSKYRQVIAVDLYGHGHTALTGRPMTIENMGDDIAALVKYLHIEKVDILGYSLGAATALQTTIRHPELVKKLVVVSTPFKRTGWYPEGLAAMDQMGPATAEMMKPSPLYQTYARIAPRPEDWPVLVTKIAEMLRKDYDRSQQVAAIQVPTMLVFGDADAVPPAHAAEFFALLGGGKKDAGWDNSGLTKNRLAILPGVTHYNITSSPLLFPAVAPFLDIPAPK
jgi:pimeloyl-ACP methyl ester carboxylesterase